MKTGSLWFQFHNEMLLVYAILALRFIGLLFSYQLPKFWRLLECQLHRNRFSYCFVSMEDNMSRRIIKG